MGLSLNLNKGPEEHPLCFGEQQPPQTPVPSVIKYRWSSPRGAGLTGGGAEYAAEMGLFGRLLTNCPTASAEARAIDAHETVTRPPSGAERPGVPLP